MTHNKKLSYRRDSARCGHSRSLKVVHCANRRCIYDFVLALNSNWPLASTVLEISHLVCTSIPHLSFRWNLKKTAGSRWTCFQLLWCQGAQNIELSNHKVNHMITMHARRRRTNRQTDRRTNIMAIARWLILTNASCAKNYRFWQLSKKSNIISSAAYIQTNV